MIETVYFRAKRNLMNEKSIHKFRLLIYLSFFLRKIYLDFSQNSKFYKLEDSKKDLKIKNSN